MATVSGTFSDVGRSAFLLVKPNDSFTYSVDTSVDFDGTVYLEQTKDNGQSYHILATITADVSSTLVENVEGAISFRCELGVGTESLTGTAAYTLSDVDVVLQEFKDKNGKTIFAVTEAGVQVTGTSSVTGAATVGGALSVTGALSGGSVGAVPTTDGVGAKNGATVTAVEYGDGAVHKTVLTLVNTPVSVVSVTTGNGVGGVKVYDYPEGYIHVHGCVGNFTLGVQTQGDFTDGTPEGDIGIGSAAPANADALGTDATDDDYGTATAFTMTAYAATAAVPPEPSANFDGTTTAKDVYVNVLIDAADINDDTTTNVLVSGTITLVWSNLGDY